MNIIAQKRLIFTESDQNHNKYWEIDLYDNNDVVTRWARVGYNPQTKTFPNAGLSFFEKKIREKNAKGYTELKTVGGPTSANVAQTKDVGRHELREIAKSQIIKSSNPQLDRLIDRLVQSNIHRITSSTQITFNSATGLFSTPLGIVTPDGITEARNLLVTLNQCVSRRDWTSGIMSGAVNQYLRIVPQNVGMKRFDASTLFPDTTSVQKQSDVLDSLEASYQALQTSTSATPTASGKPIEQVFKVDLDVLDDQKEINRLIQWFNSTNRSQHGYGNLRIKTFLKVKIHDNWNNFNTRMGNNAETWHGSSEANLLSILKTGLKVSPPATAAVCGAMFGRGHYGAIDSSKSLQYTYGRFTGGNRGSSGWLFVTDFAMGNTFFIKSYGGNKPAGYDSIWAKASNTGLKFDELIVPQDSQVRIKYLLEIG